jgi:elongation factor Ts
MEISMDLIKALRDETGVSVMQCKKALEDSKGDREKALMALRKKSGEIAAKKGDRTLGAGVVAAYIHSNGTVGAMVELSCETDFVAKNEEFKKLAYDLAMHVAAVSPKYKSVEEVTTEDAEKAKTFFKEEVDKMDKPAEIKAKALQGKLDVYLKEQALLEQPFVKNPDTLIKDLITGAIQKFGEKTEVTRFVRYAVGK